jgi:hypothetical protein
MCQGTNESSLLAPNRDTFRAVVDWRDLDRASGGIEYIIGVGANKEPMLALG